MAKKIPLKDKELIKKRVAQGMSYEKAMEGTAVSSLSTVSSIVKQDSKGVEHIRVKYLKLIRKYGAKDIDRAKLWAEMTKAVKVVDGKKTPDWTSRREALRYIDNLADISNVVKDEGQVRVNVLTVVGADRKEYGF